MPDPITPLATPSALWSRARSDYLAGVTADEACRRYGLSRSRFFERAKAEGWRRADLTPAPDEDDFALDADAPLASGRTMADRAWRRAQWAIGKGRIAEAQAWTRLTRDLRRLALDEAGLRVWLDMLRRDSKLEAAAKPTISIADMPPEVLDDPDAAVAWVAEAMQWPELLAEAPGKAGPPPEESGQETVAQTADCPENPDFPDSDFESGEAIDAEPDRPAGDDRDSWAAWATLCERMQAERPHEPWWGEALDADPAAELPPDPHALTG